MRRLFILSLFLTFSVVLYSGDDIVFPIEKREYFGYICSTLIDIPGQKVRGYDTRGMYHITYTSTRDGGNKLVLLYQVDGMNTKVEKRILTGIRMCVESMNGYDCIRVRDCNGKSLLWLIGGIDDELRSAFYIFHKAIL